jgi:3-hydroxyisobutyrate dehydrogenase-like beta-hydroxyacid dehydrogenase
VTTTSLKIAFLGLGAMGSRMAANLVKAGHAVTVWNRDLAKAQAFCQHGGALAGTPKAAADGADIVISMVTDDAAARHVWLDAGSGALAGMKPGAVAIECSTVTPAWIRALGAAVAGKGVSLLDAPVAGSRPQAEAGQLVFMVGGETAAFARAEPALAPLAAKVMHVGALGQGAVLKLAVNTLFAAQLESVAELLGFLSRNGFEAQQAAELLGAFPIVAPPVAGAARMMATKSTAPLFTIDLIEKDLGYILDTAKASGADLPGAASARAAFQRAQGRGLGQANVSGLAAVFA